MKEIERVTNKINRLREVAQVLEDSIRDVDEGSICRLSKREWVDWFEETLIEEGCYLSTEEIKALSEFMASNNNLDI